ASAFDLALDFQGLLKSSVIARLSGARCVYGFARDALREPASRFFLHQTISIPTGLNVIYKNLILAESALGISVPGNAGDLEFPIAIDENHEREAAAACAGSDGRYAVLNPGGGWPTKLWSAEKFGALADELWSHYGIHSLISFGPGEKQLATAALSAAKLGKA